ncbi:MAG: AI-2E family transporter [Christensenellales bacterium]|jgi:predicted PurR-regulated permease PerM
MTSNEARQKTGIGRMAWKALAILFALTMLFLARNALRDIFMIVLPAAVIAFLLLPLQKIYEKKFSPALSAVLCILSLLVPLGILVWASVPSIISQAELYSKRLPELFDYATGIVDRFVQRMGEMNLPVGNLESAGDEMLAKMTEGAQNFVNGMFASLSSAGKYFLSPIIAFYMLKDREKMADFAKRLIPSKNRSAIVKFFMDVGKFLLDYIKKQMMISLITAALTAIGLALAGIDAFLFLGLIMGLFNLIPYFGPLLGAIPIALFSVIQGPAKLLWAMVVVFAVQQIESVLITPRMLSGVSGFHPAVVILLMLLGGSLFGLWGMLLAVPVASILKSAYISFTNAKLYRKNV